MAAQSAAACCGNCATGGACAANKDTMTTTAKPQGFALRVGAVQTRISTTSAARVAKREAAEAKAAAKRDAAEAKAAAKRDAATAKKAAKKAKAVAKRTAAKAKAVARQAKVKAKATAKREAKAAARARKSPSSCSGSIAANLELAKTQATKAANRLKTAAASLTKRHDAAAERLRTAQRTAEQKLEALMRSATSAVARRLYKRRLDRQRASLRLRLGILARELKSELKGLPRKIECSILGKSAARRIVESCGNSCHLGLPGGTGGAETLVTLQTGRGSLKVLPARFVLTSAQSLIPSHDPQSFSPRSDYPELVQERRYDADQAEQLKVLDIAQNMQPGLVANTNVGAVDGTPVAVNGVGVVLGGNGRTMGVQRAYLRGNDKLADYLARYPSQFGFTAAQVKAIADPIVVRVIDATRSEWPRLVRDLNVSLTQAMDLATEAVAQARHFPPDVVKILASGLADAEIGEWLRSRASLPLVGALERSGFLTRANRARYLTKEGLLSADARTALERQLVAALVPDAALLDRLGPEIQNTLTRSAPFWLGAAAAGGTWDVHASLRAALQDLAEMRSDKQCLAQWQQQASIVPRATRKGTIGETLLQVLDLASAKPVIFSRIARAFYAASVGGGGLFGAKDPMQALTEAANEAKVEPTSAASRRRCRK
jgi:colicin import membrane protein